MFDRESVFKIGNRLKAVADLLDSGHTETAQGYLKEIASGIDPKYAAYCQSAIEAANRNADDAEMMRIIGQGLVDHVLEKDDE